MNLSDELTLKLLSGSLTDDERTELDRLLSSDEAAQRLHLNMLDLEAALVAMGPAPDVTKATLESLQQQESRDLEQAVMRTISALPVPAWSQRPGGTALPSRPSRRDGSGEPSYKTIFYVGLMAASVLLVVGGWMWWPRESQTPQVVTLLPSVEVRLVELEGETEVRHASGEPTPAKQDSVLAPGNVLRTTGDDGFARLEFSDGSWVEVAADSQVRLEKVEHAAAPRMILTTGQLRADVKSSKVGKPLVIVTPQAEVRSKGSRFSVCASMGDATQVEAETGSVQFIRLADGRSVDVDAGSYAVVQADAGALVVHRMVPTSVKARFQLSFRGTKHLAYSADGTLLTALSLQRAAVFDVRTSQAREIGGKFPGNIVRVGLSGSGQTAVWGLKSGEIQLLDTAKGTLGKAMPSPGNAPFLLAISPDGMKLACTSFGAGALVRLRYDDKDDWHNLVLTQTAQSLAFSPDSRQLAVGLAPSRKEPLASVTFYDANTKKRVHALPVPGTGLDSIGILAFSPDGKRLAGATRRSLFVWDLTTNQLLGSRDAADGWAERICALGFSPDGRWLAASAGLGRVRLWDIPENRDVAVVDCKTRLIHALAFSPDGNTLAVGPDKNDVQLWDLTPLRPTQ